MTRLTAALPEPDDDLTGRQVGDFVLLRRLGRGGMAEVYLAEQLSLHRQVAFKVLRRELARDPQYVSRFEKEAQNAASLIHANIVQIYEVGPIDGVHFIAQEYVNGKNLKQYIQAHGGLDVLLVIAVLRQVTAALVKASERGITHRDIKPENILIAANGDVKVADFGLAKNVLRSTETQLGITMGTPLYMSPEQTEGKNVDPRSDLYSLGVTCYEMLAGRPPFEADSAIAIALKHLNEQPKPLQEIRKDIPEPLVNIIHRLLQKKPESRFQSAAELLKELRNLKVDEQDAKWTEALDHLNFVEAPTLKSALAATQQLDALMKREKQPASRATAFHPLAIGIISVLLSIIVFFGGILVAFANRPADLLAVRPEERKAVPRQQTVQQQLRYAQQIRTEAAYRAVELYFPRDKSNTNLVYCRYADARLGEIYLAEKRFDEAIRVYRSLEGSGEQDKDFKTIAYCGLAIAYDGKWKSRQSGENSSQSAEQLADLSLQYVNKLRTFNSAVWNNLESGRNPFPIPSELAELFRNVPRA